MHPVCFTIGSFPVYSYGVLFAAAFIVFTLCVYRESLRRGLNADAMVNLAIMNVMAGIIGGRVLHVVMNLRYYIRHPLDIPNFYLGGLAWYGGFFAAFVVSYWYLRARKIDPWIAGDIMLPYVALGQAIGKIGCFLRGCCYGGAAGSWPLAVIFPADPVRRHPTQLYSAALFALIAVALLAWRRHKRFNGEIFLGYCILTGAERFAIDFLRDDNPRIMGILTASQCIAATVFVVAVIIFTIKADLWRRSSTPSK